MYGPALETWAQEPLTSSAVDVWTKRTRRPIVNEWYTVDNYHHDTGTGADLYSAGPSRGCGGNGLWIDGKLYPSANFRNSRVIASGPIRVMFELTYDTWDANGVKVSEVKRITLDAGQNLDRFESRYKVESGTAELTHAIGLKKAGSPLMSSSKEQGWIRTWESVRDQKQPAGELGMAVIVDPSQIVSFTEDKGNYLIAAKVPADKTAVYYAGFGWTKSGDFAKVEDWDGYVSQFAARLRAPLQVTLAAK
jgi:pectinesterase